MTYTYICDTCHKEFEVEVPTIKDDPGCMVHCIHCEDGMGWKKVTGGQGFVLKGGGWASTGYSGGKKI